MKFDYTSVISLVKKIIIPYICAIAPIIIGKQFITYKMTTLNVLIVLACYGIISVLIYVVMTYKNKALEEVFGSDTIDNFMRKLHLKK